MDTDELRIRIPDLFEQVLKDSYNEALEDLRPHQDRMVFTGIDSSILDKLKEQ